MRRKAALSFAVILFLTALLLSAAYFLTPHAVVRSPEHTRLSVIHMDSPNGSGTSSSWVPMTEEDQAVAKKLWSIFPLSRNVIPSREPSTEGTPPIGM